MTILFIVLNIISYIADAVTVYKTVKAVWQWTRQIMIKRFKRKSVRTCKVLHARRFKSIKKKKDPHL